MSRTAIGVVVVVVLAVGLLAAAGAAGMLSASSPTPGPVAVGASPSPAAVPSASPDPSASGGVEPQPSASAEPSAVALAHPGAHARHGARAAHRRLVKPAVATRHVIAVMIDDQFDARPQSGLTDADVVWQAPAEGGIPRYMALFQDGQPAGRRARSAARASTSSPGRPSGGRCTSTSAARRRRSRSSTRPRASGGVVYDADEFRWGGGRYLWRVTDRVRARTTCTRTRSTCGSWPSGSGAKAVDRQAGRGRSRPTLPIAQRPEGGTIVVPYLANRITYKYDRKTNTYLRSVTGETKQTDAARRSGSRRRTWSSWSCASRRSTTARTSTGSRREFIGHGHGVHLDQRQDHQGHLEQEVADGPDPVLRHERQAGHAHRRARRSSRSCRRAPRSTFKQGKVAAAGPARGPRAPSARRRATLTRPDGPSGSQQRRRPRRRPPRPRASRARRRPRCGIVRRARARRGDERAWRPSSAQAAPERRREARRVAAAPRGSRPRPTISGSAPTALATTGTPGRERLDRGEPGRLGADRLERDARPGDERREPVVGSRGA